MIIRQFDPAEYSQLIPTIPTEDLVQFLDNEGSFLYGMEGEKLVSHELMFSLLKRELSVRGALEVLAVKDPGPVERDREQQGEDYSDGYSDGNWFDGDGDPGNWWKI